MNPLSALYGSGNAVRATGSTIAVCYPPADSKGPVVSIGNITVGGSGKTPFVIALGELLKRRGVSFDVLSRGYGRKTKGVALVDPDGSARDFGDEPLLIARKLEVSVVIGEDRYAAGRFAEENFGPRLHLLDDGFQHRGLARDFDIVLVNASDAQDALFPMGRLREPLSALARADAVVLTNDTSGEGLPITHQKVWRVQRDIVAPQVDEPCMAFCGIARPGYVFRATARDGRNHRCYPHLPRSSFVQQVRYSRSAGSARQKAGATSFVTTEKDAINLDAHLEVLAPTHIVPVYMQIEDANTVAKTIWAAIAARNSPPA